MIKEYHLVVTDNNGFVQPVLDVFEHEGVITKDDIVAFFRTGLGDVPPDEQDCYRGFDVVVFEDTNMFGPEKEITRFCNFDPFIND